MGAINGQHAQLLAASGTSTTFADEQMDDAGDHKKYTIHTAAHRYWDDATAVVIQESTDSGSSWHSITPDSIQYPGGIINFTVARNSAYLYRAHSGKYFTITTCGGGKEWDLTVVVDTYDTTEFGQGFHGYIAGLKGGSGTLDRFWVDQYFWTLVSSGAARGILALYLDTTSGQRYEGYAFIRQIGDKIPVAGVVEENVQFTIDKTLYYNPGP